MNNTISIIFRRKGTGRQVLKYNLRKRRAEILISVLGLAISPRKKPYLRQLKHILTLVPSQMRNLNVVHGNIP